MIVVDASVAVEVLLRTPLGERIASHVLHQPRHAPHLIDAECAHTLRRLVHEKALNKNFAEAALHNMIASLLTCDARLSRSHGHRARIELLS